MLGRKANSHLGLLKELWTSEVETPEVQSMYMYVLHLRNRTEQTCELAQQMNKLHERNKRHYDKKTKVRELKVGCEVLILLPDSSNKLTVKWKGPFKIVLKILTRRLEGKVQEFLGRDQYGFRSGRGTRDAIAALRVLYERTLEFNKVYILLCGF